MVVKDEVKSIDMNSELPLVPTLRGQPYTQVLRHLDNRLIYNERPEVSTLIKILVNQIPKNLCIRLTAERGNEVILSP